MEEETDNRVHSDEEVLPKKKKEKAKKSTKSKKQQKSDEIREKQEKGANVHVLDPITITTFADLPLSTRTQESLTESGYTKPTDIQKEGIVLALQHKDVLGAARTGSGKTLAFLVPVLELLWQEGWSNEDNLGAMIISPTRELALQTYEVLRKVGKRHDFSAGLIIGGKDLQDEQQRITNTNIIIGTPGRILQHFDETPGFDCYNLKVLVLDEADRILDLGFAQTLNAIIDCLPGDRQTLLYSATQTKSVKDLARLSLKKPNYIDVHEAAKYSTPKKLIQNYIYVELQDKITFLFSFIRNHLKSKCIVFLSSCKQVKFVYEVFRKLRPGIPLQALYGKQKQLKRVAIYNRFCGIQNAVLFATDIAARGLDFTAVNWVVQYDCPESPDTYIHRVGRTARFEKGGQALMMLLPSESEMVTKLTTRKVPIHELKSNPKKMRTIQGKLASFCVQDQQIKDWAQKSIVSYARSVFLQSDKTVFDVNKLPLDKLSTSCGLMATPKLQFMKKKMKKMGPADGEESEESIAKALKSAEYKFPAMSESSEGKLVGVSDDDSDTDDVLVAKSSNQHHENIEAEAPKETSRSKRATKAKLAKAVINKNITLGSKIIFNEDGEEQEDVSEINPLINDDDEDEDDDADDGIAGIDITKARERLQKQDNIDYAKEKERIKLKHKLTKQKEKRDRGEEYEDVGVQLAEPEEEEDSDSMEEEEEEAPPAKRSRKQDGEEDDSLKRHITSSLEEDEGLALHLLGVG